MSLSAARLFVKVKAPYVFVPRGGKKIAARIAKDFVTFIDGFVEKYNELNRTNFDPAQGLTVLLNANVNPGALFDEYRGLAEQAKPALSGWSGQDGFDEGWKWLTPQFSDWFIEVVVPRPCKIDEYTNYPGAIWLTETIMTHPNGRQFMRGFVEELKYFLYPHAPRATNNAPPSEVSSR